MIYLDNAASSLVLPCALEAFIKAPQGNPNSGHIAGQAARKALELAREKISEYIGCLPDEVYFVSCASEAAALALDTMDSCCKSVSVSEYEHHCVRDFFKRGPTPRFLACQYGLRENGIAQMLVQNETGQIFQIPQKEKGELLLVDATAAVGHLSVNFNKLGADYLIGDAMKFGGVPGCGFLIAKKGAPLAWHHEGTPPVRLICAMAAALKWQTERIGEHAHYIRRLNVRMRDVLGAEFTTTLPDINVGNIEAVSPYILSGRFDGVPSEALVAAASAHGVCISAGSACSTGKLEASPALLASGLTERQAMQTIRISFSFGTTFAEIDEAGKIIRECAMALKSM